MTHFLLILIVMVVVFFGASVVLFYGDCIWKFLVTLPDRYSTRQKAQHEAKKKRLVERTIVASEEEAAAERAFKKVRAQQRALFAQQRQDLIDFEYELTGTRPEPHQSIGSVRGGGDYVIEELRSHHDVDVVERVPVEAYVHESTQQMWKEYETGLIEQLARGIFTQGEVREQLGLPTVVNMGGPLGRVALPDPPREMHR